MTGKSDFIMWEYTGQKRPPFAEQPRKGQESVWDYPRPPSLADDGRHIQVRAGDLVIADTTRAVRLLETASPPTFYIPQEDVRTELLAAHPSTSYCEWKGDAQYWALKRDNGVRDRSRDSSESPATWLSTRRGSNVTSMTSGCSRSRASSTAAG